jgi:cell division protein FtsB
MYRFANFYFYFAGLVFLLGITRGNNNALVYYQLRDKKLSLQSRILEITKSNTTTTLEIARIKEFPEYARRNLKDKYHSTEKGEKLVFIDD